MSRSYRVVCLAFVFVALMLCGSADSPPGRKEGVRCYRRFGGAEIRQDLAVLFTTLREAHPDLYRVSGKIALEDHMHTMARNMRRGACYPELVREIALLLTKVGCAATSWGHAPAYLQFRDSVVPLFPLEITIREERFFVRENHAADTNVHCGDEILAFNGYKPAAYLRANRVLLPVDGHIPSFQDRWLEAYFPMHHSNFWEQPQKFHLLMRDSLSGRTYRVNLPALLKKAQIRKPGKKTSDAPFALSIDNEKASLRIATFNNRTIHDAGQEMGSFLDSAFREIAVRHVKTLALDLRGNAWGDIANGAMLFGYLSAGPYRYVGSYRISEPKLTYASEVLFMPLPDTALINELTRLKNPPLNAFTDSLQVITDGWNVNAGGFLVNRLRQRSKTEFTGYGPGSEVFGCNDQQLVLQLPNSGICIYIPTVQLVADM